MSTAKDYLEAIAGIVGDDVSDGQISLRFNWNDRYEAKAVVARMREMKAELRLLKKDVGMTVSSIKSHFISERNAVGKSLASGIAGAFFGRRTIGSINSSTKDQLRRSQEVAVQPFEEVKRIIDHLLHQIDRLKFQVEQSPEYRLEPVAPPPLPALPPPLLPATRRFQASINGQTKGPYTMEQLHALHDAGAIQDDTRCRIEGTKEWRPYAAFRA